MCDSGFFSKHLFLRIHPDTGHIQTREGTTHWSLKMYLDKEPEGLVFEQALLWAVWVTPDHPLTTGKMITNVSWSNFPLKELHHTELFFTQTSQGQRLGFFYIPHSDWYVFSIHGRHFVLWPTVVLTQISVWLIFVHTFMEHEDTFSYMLCFSQGFSTLKLLTFGTRRLFAQGGCPGHGRTFGGISCLYSLMPSEPPTVVIQTLSRHCQVSPLGQDCPQQRIPGLN